MTFYLNDCFKQLFEFYALNSRHARAALKHKRQIFVGNSPRKKRNARIFIRALLRGLGEGT